MLPILHTIYLIWSYYNSFWIKTLQRYTISTSKIKYFVLLGLILSVATIIRFIKMLFPNHHTKKVQQIPLNSLSSVFLKVGVLFYNCSDYIKWDIRYNYEKVHILNYFVLKDSVIVWSLGVRIFKWK